MGSQGASSPLFMGVCEVYDFLRLALTFTTSCPYLNVGFRFCFVSDCSMRTFADFPWRVLTPKPIL